MLFANLYKNKLVDKNFGTKSRFNLYFLSGEEPEETDPSNENHDNILLYLNPYINLNVIHPLKEERENKDELFFTIKPNKQNLNSYSKENKKDKRIFNIEYIKKNSVFTQIEKDLPIDEEAFLKKKRSNRKKSRKEYQDNIRKKIKRGFLNNTLVKKLNERLKRIGSKLFFGKFPQNLVADINKDSNKEIINMTLLEIFKKKELCGEKDLNNYYHNLRMVKTKEIQENEELKKY